MKGLVHPDCGGLMRKSSSRNHHGQEETLYSQTAWEASTKNVTYMQTHGYRMDTWSHGHEVSGRTNSVKVLTWRSWLSTRAKERFVWMIIEKQEKR